MESVDPVFALVIRSALVALFGVAALHKIRDLRRFSATVRDYRILPEAWSGAGAFGLAGVETATALALLSPATDPLGPLAALALLASYSGAIAWNLARGRRDIDCGCLGPAHRQKLSWGLIARNALVSVGAVVLLLPNTARTLSWIDAVSITGGLCMLVVVWHAAHQIGAVSGTRPLRLSGGTS